MNPIDKTIRNLTRETAQRIADELRSPREGIHTAVEKQGRYPAFSPEKRYSVRMVINV